MRQVESAQAELKSSSRYRRVVKTGKLDLGFLVGRDLMLVLVVVALGLCGAVVSPAFPTASNLLTVLRQISMTGIIGVGMTIVIVGGGIDLSVGSIVALVSVVVAQAMASGRPIVVAMLLGLAIGAGLGAINGLGVVLGRIPPFIMTLGMMVMARGGAFLYSAGRPISLGVAADRFGWLGQGFLGPFPVPVLCFLVVAAVGAFVLRMTFWGRYVYAVGGNPEASRLAGIDVGRIVWSTYLVSGTLAAFAGLISLSRLSAGEPIAGQLWELDAIAMSVIGGASLSGGVGGVGGAFCGALIIGLLSNVLNLAGVSPFVQEIVKGGVIAGAVAVQQLRSKAAR